MSELRLYTFTNFMLNTISQGIQPAHVVGDLGIKYRFDNSSEGERYWDWATNHKTLISLNGGNYAMIVEKYNQLTELVDMVAIPLPVCPFFEDEATLGGLMTSVGVILPEEIFDAFEGENGAYVYKRFVKDSNNMTEVWIYEVGSPEWNLVKLVKSCGLAR